MVASFSLLLSHKTSIGHSTIQSAVFFSHKKSASVISTTSQPNTVFIFAFCLEAAQIRNTDALKLFAMTKL